MSDNLSTVEVEVEVEQILAAEKNLTQKKPMKLRSNMVYVIDLEGKLIALPLTDGSLEQYAKVHLEGKFRFLLFTDLHKILDTPGLILSHRKGLIVLSYVKTEGMLNTAKVQALELLQKGVAELVIFCCLKEKYEDSESSEVNMTTTEGLVAFVTKRMVSKQKLQLNIGSKGYIIKRIVLGCGIKFVEGVALIDDSPSNVISGLIAKHQLPSTIKWIVTLVYQPTEKSLEKPLSVIIEEINQHFDKIGAIWDSASASASASAAASPSPSPSFVLKCEVEQTLPAPSANADASASATLSVVPDANSCKD